MQEFTITEYTNMENTDTSNISPKEENTDFEQILDNISDEFVQEGGLNTNNNWYCLPYILSEHELSSQKNIENVTSSELGDYVFINVKYKQNFIENNSSIFDKEICEHCIDNDNANVVSFTVPKDKEYICKMIIQKGINVMDTDFIKKYILV